MSSVQKERQRPPMFKPFCKSRLDRLLLSKSIKQRRPVKLCLKRCATGLLCFNLFVKADLTVSFFQKG